jgi:dTDP-4-amino-4,6-dideoxygalactose transaminase
MHARTITPVSRIQSADLQRQCASIRAELDRAISDVIASGWFVGGPTVERFEQNFAAYCETSHCVTVASGTDALILALKALGIGAGDEVITVSHTFIATVAAVVHIGAMPVLVDIDPDTYCIDPAAIESKITARTKAVIPVHLNGHPADMDAVNAIADKHGLAVLEDAAQAHGALYKGRKTGSLGHAAAFSFYPGKNLGAFGDGGAITTSDAGLADRLRRLRDHGRVDKFTHAEFGFNSRLDAIQAAILDVKLRRLDEWNERRREIAMEYSRRFADLEEIVAPPVSADVTSVWHVYALRALRRAVLQAAMDDENISYGIHYPIPVHLQPAWDTQFCKTRSKGEFPLIEHYTSQLISLPVHESLTDSEVDRVASVVCAAATCGPRGDSPEPWRTM